MADAGFEPLACEPSHRGLEELSQIDYNPFTAALRATEDELAEMVQRRVTLVEHLTWATQFDPAGEVAEVARLGSDLEERGAELGRLDEDITELAAASRLLASRTPTVESAARLGLNPFRWLTAEYDDAKAHLRAHRQEIVRLRGRMQAVESERAQVAREVAQLTDRVSDKEEALARFRRFRPDQTEQEIAKIDAELPLSEGKRDDLKTRKANIDRAVDAPLAELRDYESEIGQRESIVSKLRSELSELEGQITEAERIDEKISKASNGYERAMLHQESERRFGFGSPRAAIRDLRSQLRSIPSKIRDHERQITRIRRDMAKTEQRIKKLVTVAARDIRALIVDGNNCCYEDSDFIGLAALIPMTEELAKRFDVTVIFDAAIRGRLGVSDDDLRRTLPAAKVHVVASRSKADETILDAADDPTVWVISNDRFGEYREKTGVKEQRVIRHEIVRGRVLVHDLGVNELLDQRTTSGR